MKDAGILDADYVIVRRQEPPRTERSSWRWSARRPTVKRFFKEKDHVRLQPENEALEPILTRT